MKVVVAVSGLNLANFGGKPKATGEGPLAGIKWVLTNPGIGTTVPHMTNIAELEMNFRAMSEPYTPADEQLLYTLNEQIRPALEVALKVALERYPQPKRHREDQGGWRYYRYHQDSDSDLSVTSWSLMFLRSCRNAGLDVPSQSIEVTRNSPAPSFSAVIASSKGV